MSAASSYPLGFALLITALTASGQSQDEWPVSAASEQGLSQEALSRLDKQIRTQLPHLRSLLIARRGRLVFENYYGDASRDGLHNMQSMTKSVSSALVGIEARLSFDKAFANPVEEILRWRLLYDPGHGFSYSSAAAHLLGGVLRAVSGRATAERQTSCL